MPRSPAFNEVLVSVNIEQSVRAMVVDLMGRGWYVQASIVLEVGCVKALVIGGNRFFGKRLVGLLLSKGVKVTLLNRGHLDDGFGNQVDRIKMDRRHLSAKSPELKNARWDIVFDQSCYDASEAEGACYAFSGRVSKYVFTSTQAVYDNGRALTESDFDPYKYRFSKIVSTIESYSEGKRQAEATFFSRAQFPVTAVRFPIVLGPDDYTERLKFHVVRVAKGIPIYFPDVNARISFVHARDAAEFLASLVAQDIPGPVNCCSPEPISLRSLLKEIEKVVGRETVLAASPSGGEKSPFGIELDWYMDIDRLKAHGPIPAPIEQWLPGLISELYA